MFGLIRRNRRAKGRNKSSQFRKNSAAKELSGSSSSESLLDRDLFAQCGFADHMAAYVGRTVTVFVRGGGASGSGFTGILMSVHIAYIQLIAFIGPIPGCSYHPGYPETGSNTEVISGLGSVIHIPLNKITSFVHNSL